MRFGLPRYARPKMPAGKKSPVGYGIGDFVQPDRSIDTFGRGSSLRYDAIA